MKNIFNILLGLTFAGCLTANAQTVAQPMQVTGTTPVKPFQFSVNTLSGNTPFWAVSVSSNYAQRTAGQFGYDGADQQIAVTGYLGNKFTLYANADLGFAHNGGTTTAQQLEVIRDVVGGGKVYGLRLGIGLGANRDFSSTGAAFSRITAAYEATGWRLGGNLRIEKAFSSSRDGIDLVSSFGYQHRFGKAFFAGVELMGQDLEGFWETDEAEGGAKLMVGPSLNYAPINSRFSFSLAGGPVFYATHSSVLNSGAIRDIGSSAAQNGYSVKATVAIALQKL